MGRSNLLSALVTVLVTAVLAAGCGSTTSGEPTPVDPPPVDRPDPPSSTSSPPPRTETAPTVKDPLDASRYLDRPCTVLNDAQLAGLGVIRPGISETEGAIAENIGPQCIWHAEPEVNSTIDVGFITADEHGLGGLYAARETQEYFEETTVGGYPAVFHSGVDLRERGSCNISVGISHTLSFRSAEEGVLDASRACARAKKVAEAVVTTLKGVV
jgi:Protein of unknown function (DUF3558)